jgi:hypothetical protein
MIKLEYFGQPPQPAARPPVTAELVEAVTKPVTKPIVTKPTNITKPKRGGPTDRRRSHDATRATIPPPRQAEGEHRSRSRLARDGRLVRIPLRATETVKEGARRSALIYSRWLPTTPAVERPHEGAELRSWLKRNGEAHARARPMVYAAAPSHFARTASPHAGSSRSL